MSAAKERDWQKIYVTAFGKMDSNQDGEAEAAFCQVRQIHVKQGIGFRNILDRVQNAADPTEFERMQRRVGEVEKANVTLGRQNADLHRENTQLRALNDKCSILRAFSRAAQAARREISGIGRRIKEGGGRGVYQGSLV